MLQLLAGRGTHVVSTVPASMALLDNGVGDNARVARCTNALTTRPRSPAEPFVQMRQEACNTELSDTEPTECTLQRQGRGTRSPWGSSAKELGERSCCRALQLRRSLGAAATLALIPATDVRRQALDARAGWHAGMEMKAKERANLGARVTLGLARFGQLQWKLDGRICRERVQQETTLKETWGRGQLERCNGTRTTRRAEGKRRVRQQLALEVATDRASRAVTPTMVASSRPPRHRTPTAISSCREGVVSPSEVPTSASSRADFARGQVCFVKPKLAGTPTAAGECAKEPGSFCLPQSLHGEVSKSCDLNIWFPPAGLGRAAGSIAEARCTLRP